MTAITCPARARARQTGMTSIQTGIQTGMQTRASIGLTGMTGITLYVTCAGARARACKTGPNTTSRTQGVMPVIPVTPYKSTTYITSPTPSNHPSYPSKEKLMGERQAMRFEIQVQGLDKVRHLMDRLSSEQIQQAQVDAMTDAAHHIRRAMAAEAKRAFDQPTPYILRSFIFKPPTLQHPQTTVLPTYYNRQGVDPQKVLRAQAFGGRRRDKRMELALRRLGLLPAGLQAVVPHTPYPGSTDGRGNFRGAFVQQMLSYLSGEMKKASRRRLHRKGVDEHGRATIQGRRYFVSPGKAYGAHLHAGIWAASGVHSHHVAPVVIFASAGNYPPRYDTERIARAADAVPYLEKRMRYRIRKAAGV